MDLLEKSKSCSLPEIVPFNIPKSHPKIIQKLQEGEFALLKSLLPKFEFDEILQILRYDDYFLFPSVKIFIFYSFSTPNKPKKTL